MVFTTKHVMYQLIRSKSLYVGIFLPSRE